MTPEYRSAFDELIRKGHSGRLKRRAFLERAVALGFSSVSALSLLESCATSSPRTPDGTVYLIWQAEYDPSDTQQQLVEAFNERNQGRIHVTMRIGPDGTNDLVALERNIFKARSTAIDLFSVDIIYIAEFVRQRWLQPISEQRWPQQEREKYLQTPIRACTLNGQLWAAPLRSDVGMLYYRTDLLPHPPGTWEELTSMAETVLAQKKHPRYGYVWQAAQYEGLVCNFDEVLHGFGGSLFLDPSHPTIVTVNSPQARQALTTMLNWIEKKISPDDTDTYTEEVTRKTWEQGDAVFMRNWSYAYSHSQQTLLAQKFTIHPMLSGGNNPTGHSSLGGWQLAINAFSDPVKQDAAWEFIQYMLQPEAQKKGATTASWTPTLMSVYEDPEILKKVPWLKRLNPLLQTAVPRPITANYDAISTAIRFYVRQALARRASVSDALTALAGKLEQISSSSQISPHP